MSSKVRQSVENNTGTHTSTLTENTEPGTSWPPPDPDRMFRVNRTFDTDQAFTQSLDPEDFRRRQEADRLRAQGVRDDSSVYRRQPFHLRYRPDGTQKEHRTKKMEYPDEEYAVHSGEESDTGDDQKPELSTNEGEESWRNSEGERLGDFGVDEDVEFYDEDEVPLAELMRRRKEGVA